MSAAIRPDAAPPEAPTEPDRTGPDAGWEAVIPPIPSLAHTKDIAPDPPFGQIYGSRAGGYHGGAICPRCLTMVRFRGAFVAEADSPTGQYIELTCRAAGRGSVGEIRGTRVLHMRWTCPACPPGQGYRQLALDVESREPEFRAVFVRRADGGTP